MQDLLLTIVIGVMALALALIGCLLLGGKANRARISAIALLVLVLPLFFLVRPALALNYYGLLFTEALFAFTVPVYCLIVACSDWMEWLSPPPQQKTRINRERSIFMALCSTIVGIGLALIFLPRVVTAISDIASGPSFGTGVVEQLNIRAGRGGVTGGDFTIHGVSYQTVDLYWYHTLSVGQSIKFAYSPEGHYGFPADQMILAPAGIALPLLVFGISLLVFSVGYQILRPTNYRTAVRRRSTERNQVGQIMETVAEYREYRWTKDVGTILFLMIAPLILFGFILLILISK